MQGKTHRPGLYQCNACREPFTVTVGTLYERSHIPLNKWLAATHLLMARKKGMSALQIEPHARRALQDRLVPVPPHPREPARDDARARSAAQNKIVEADETYVGGKEKNKHVQAQPGSKVPATARKPSFSLVERGGKVRSFHVADVNAARRCANPGRLKSTAQSYLMTDEAAAISPMGREFAGHDTVNHRLDEYVRGDVLTRTRSKAISRSSSAASSAPITMSASST